MLFAPMLSAAIGLFQPPGSASFFNVTSSYARPTVDFAASGRLDSPNGQCGPGSIHKNHSMLLGTKVRATSLIPYPPEFAAQADALCCSLSASGSGKYYTLTNLGPDPTHPKEDSFLCTTYGEGPNVTFVPGNDSVSAGYASNPPPPDPKCMERTTLSGCLKKDMYNIAACIWSNGACAYEPPIDCGGFGAAAQYGPFCMGVVLADHPYPTGAPKRRLDSFNWTSGTISGKVNPVVMPPQVLKGDMWYSVTIEPPGWEICIIYNELLADGKSDPDSGFQGCAITAPPKGGQMSGPKLSRGATNNLGIFAVFTLSSGWTASGYDPAKNGNLFGSWIVWSNSTAVASPFAVSS